MKTKITLLTMVAGTAILLSGCNKDKFPDVLHGSWETKVVPVSGYGYFDGTAVNTFNEDGSYKSEVEFTDPASGCKATITYSGTFDGEEGKLTSTPTSGNVEVTSCTDNTANQASRAYTDTEIAAAKSTVDYEVDGNTLILTHSDGMQRIYRRK